MMKVEDIRKLARSKQIQVKGLSKAALVHQIQKSEGNFDCYGTASAKACDQGQCLWRDDCFSASTR